MQECVGIELQADGAISFHRNGFLTGYTGFYFSPSGIMTSIAPNADWYESDWLEGNYFWFQFGF